MREKYLSLSLTWCTKLNRRQSDLNGFCSIRPVSWMYFHNNVMTTKGVLVYIFIVYRGREQCLTEFYV